MLVATMVDAEERPGGGGTVQGVQLSITNMYASPVVVSATYQLLCDGSTPISGGFTGKMLAGTTVTRHISEYELTLDGMHDLLIYVRNFTVDGNSVQPGANVMVDFGRTAPVSYVCAVAAESGDAFLFSVSADSIQDVAGKVIRAAIVFNP